MGGGVSTSKNYTPKNFATTDIFIIETLKKTLFIQMMDEKMTAEVARCFQVVKYAKGAIIKCDSQQLFIIAEGAVDICSLFPTRSKKQYITEQLCQRKVGDFITFTGREQFLSRLMERKDRDGSDGPSRKSRKKLFAMLELNRVTADAFEGCTLLKLNRENFYKLQQTMAARKANTRNTARFSGGKRVDRHNSKMTAPERINWITSVVELESVNYLFDIPFLESVDDSRLLTLSNLCSYMYIPRGHVLCKEGEVGNRFFICIRGSLQATVQMRFNALTPTFLHNCNGTIPTHVTHTKVVAMGGSEQKTIQALKVMTSGSYFGEISLIFKIPRIATITALEDSLLIYIERTAFTNFLKVAPESSQILLEHVRLHLLDTLMKQGCAFLNAIPPMKLQELSFISELVEHHTGSTILKQGDRGDTFHIVVRGEVEMVYSRGDDDSKNQQETLRIRPGGYFGQEAIMLGIGSPITVKCIDHCLTLTLSTQAFNEFFSCLPEIYAEFCIKCLREKSTPEHILQHYDARKLWEADCVTRRRHHEVAMFESIEDFNWEIDIAEDHIQERALMIYLKYINNTARNHVPLSFATVEAIEEQLSSHEIERDIFGAARAELLERMNDDSFVDFKRSHMFQDLLMNLYCPQLMYDMLTPDLEAKLEMTYKEGFIDNEHTVNTAESFNYATPVTKIAFGADGFGSSMRNSIGRRRSSTSVARIAMTMGKTASLTHQATLRALESFPLNGESLGIQTRRKTKVDAVATLATSRRLSSTFVC